MKVLFLDFDGVLNTRDYRDVHGDSGVGIDKSRMPLVKKLVDRTGAKIVLITSLREHWDNTVYPPAKEELKNTAFPARVRELCI